MKLPEASPENKAFAGGLIMCLAYWLAQGLFDNPYFVIIYVSSVLAEVVRGLRKNN